MDSINFLGEEIEAELIGTSTTSQGVIASTTNQDVVAITTNQGIIASTTIEAVIPRSAIEGIVGAVARDRVGKAAADDVFKLAHREGQGQRRGRAVHLHHAGGEVGNRSRGGSHAGTAVIHRVAQQAAAHNRFHGNQGVGTQRSLVQHPEGTQSDDIAQSAVVGRIDASTTINRVVASGAEERVGRGVAREDVVFAIASSVDIATPRQGQVLNPISLAIWWAISPS